jgi:hypothetical protein
MLAALQGKKKAKGNIKNQKSLPKVDKLKPNCPFALCVLVKPLCP